MVALRRRGALRFVMAVLACSALASCGSFGLELLPTPDSTHDAGDAAIDASGPGDAGTDAAADGGMTCDDTGACFPSHCGDAGAPIGAGVCGCGQADALDSDDDGAPDCIDFCPGTADMRDDESCACPAGAEDTDEDGTVNCQDRCPYDPLKVTPGVCGCQRADTDRDGDGTADCLDLCPDDPNKRAPGMCSCGVSERDTDLDGLPDCLDACSGADDSPYEVDATCGSGYCREHNTPSSCKSGVETSCVPGSPLSSQDESCDGVDDDCDGRVDEDFADMDSQCGLGACASTGRVTCEGNQSTDSCVPSAPLGASDATCDAIDDDCDGRTDEDVPVESSTCSTGACAATGTIACVDGELVDSCQVREPTSSTDTTCNNLDDDCNGTTDEDFVVVSTTCGVGACARTGMRTCQAGTTVDSCVAATPSTSNDNSCNNRDDDCDGRTDESFVVSATTCGTGACASTGMRTCSAGVTRDSCVPKTPSTSVDDAATPGNGIDDDCDGAIDEDLPACDTTPRGYELGSYTLMVPGNCRRVSIQLWGGGGGGGGNSGIGAGGDGGPGGYATTDVLVAGSIQLYVGGGGASGCNEPGTNPGSSSYNGGSGGSSTGANGADGMVSGGGSGGNPSTGYDGGRGYFGGGGGGQGNGGLGGSGNGGGGGAASVFIVNGVTAAVAGGGGGGGGAKSLSVLGTLAAAGGAGGSGCGGNGQAPNANGGGGGGGGVCIGATTQSGSGVNPAASGSLPNGQARGGSATCAAGTAGYAIVTFSP